MRKLPSKIRKNGFNYSQILNCGSYYIYEQDYNSGIDYPVGDTPKELKFYEVFKVKVKPAETVFGKFHPVREVFPKDEEFGYSSWAYDSYERALAKFKDLCDD